MLLSGKLYLCSAGETFDAVALAVYGHEKYAAELLCANPEHCETMVFAGSEELKLPVIIVQSTETVPETAPWKEG